MGAFGTVAGDSNGHGLTYNLGGFIAGLDRKFAPGFRAGIAAGFNAATLYTQGMPGTGTSNTLQFALYGEYLPDAVLSRCAGGLRPQRQPHEPADRDPRPAVPHRPRATPRPTRSSASSRPATS